MIDFWLWCLLCVMGLTGWLIGFITGLAFAAEQPQGAVPARDDSGEGVRQDGSRICK